GKIGCVGADVAKVGGWVGRFVPLPEFYLQLNVALVGVTGRFLALVLTGRHTRNHDRGQDAKNRDNRHQFHQGKGGRFATSWLDQFHLSAFSTYLTVLTMSNIGR